MLFLTLFAATFDDKRTWRQIAKDLLISAASGISLPFLTVYTAGLYIRNYDQPTKHKYKSRMMLLKLYELNFEAFPQAVMSWFILYYVDLGGGGMVPWRHYNLELDNVFNILGGWSDAMESI